MPKMASKTSSMAPRLPSKGPQMASKIPKLGLQTPKVTSKTCQHIRKKQYKQQLTMIPTILTHTNLDHP